MSGPVWQMERGGEHVCTECLRTVGDAFVEGVVFDAAHHPRRALCRSCYAINGGALVASEPEPFHHSLEDKRSS